MCYDYDLLKYFNQMIYQYDNKEMSHWELSDLIQWGISNLENEVEDEAQQRNSDEEKAEDFIINDYQFTKDGQIFKP